MGEAYEVRRVYQNLVASTAITYGVLPTSADGAAAAAITLTAKAVAWTWGAWAEIAASVGAVDVQVWGVSLENMVGAASQGEVGVGSGAGAAEVEFARFPSVAATYYLPKPVRIAATIRVAGRYRTSTAAADTIDAKLLSMAGM